MAKKTPTVPAPANEEGPDKDEIIAQMQNNFQEQADVATIWQEKWQESENQNINLRREIKRLQRAAQAATPAPAPVAVPSTPDEE